MHADKRSRSSGFRQPNRQFPGSSGSLKFEHWKFNYLQNVRLAYVIDAVPWGHRPNRVCAPSRDWTNARTGESQAFEILVFFAALARWNAVAQIFLPSALNGCTWIPTTIELALRRTRTYGQTDSLHKLPDWLKQTICYTQNKYRQLTRESHGESVSAGAAWIVGMSVDVPSKNVRTSSVRG